MPDYKGNSIQVGIENPYEPYRSDAYGGFIAVFCIHCMYHETLYVYNRGHLMPPNIFFLLCFIIREILHIFPPLPP